LLPSVAPQPTGPEGPAIAEEGSAMIIAKRHPLMHRQLAREPGIASSYAGKVSVALVSLIALGAAALTVDRPAPDRAASSFADETGALAPSSAQAAADDSVSPAGREQPSARFHIPDAAVDDANARVIADL
jgi:hypothetical protein